MPAWWVALFIRRRLEDAHRFTDHRVAVVESAQVVARQRIPESIEQAPVAERTGPIGQVVARRQNLRQIVVRNQRARDGNAVAIALGDDLADQRTVLITTGIDHRDADVLLDLSRLVPAHAFYVAILLGAIPECEKDRAQHLEV